MEKDAKMKLIEAAMPLFPQKGYAGVSIREIADAAGVNSASISYYFGGKEGLYAAVLEHIYSHINAVVEMDRAEDQPPDTFVHDFAIRVVRLHKQYPYLVRYLYMEMINPTKFCDTIIKEHLMRLFTYLCNGINRSIDSGEFRPDLDVGFAALSLSAIINMFFIVAPMRHRIMQRDEEAVTYVEQAVEIYLNGVRKGAEAK